MAGLKARTRLFVLALLILSGATALTYDVWKLDTRLKRDVSIELLRGRHLQAQRILELLGQSFATLVNFEYTLWDEMYAFVGTPRRTWAASNIDVLLETYALDAVWVCTTNGRTVYGVNRWQLPELETLALLDFAPRQVFARTTSVHFFAYSPVGLLELRGSVIHPSDDNARRTAPAGYFFAARRWDAALLQRLGETVHATPHLLPVGATTGAATDTTGTAVMILRDWRGAPLAQLALATASSVTHLFDATIDSYTFHLVLRNASILLLIIALTYRYFNRPLALLSRSLARNEPQLVAHMTTDSSEFGRIARLITLYAQQKEDLLVEVQAREQSQRELQQAKDAAEMINRIVPSAVFITSADQRIQTWNKKAEELTGYTAAEMIGQHCTVFTREPCTTCCRLFDPARTAPITARECTIETKDGRRHTILKNAETFIDANGQLSGIESFVDITERKQAETYRDLGREVLQILNEPVELVDAIQRILTTLKARTGVAAVGIRLKDGEDFPYFAQQGFSKEFLLTENTLLEHGADGRVCRDKNGAVSLVCTCGLVISGNTDPANALFTRGGSFWTNDSFPLLSLAPDQDPRYHPRNQCMHQGFSSVALIPIRTKDTMVGLIHLDDRRKGCFTLEMIELLEGIASHIGAALMRKQAETALAETNAYLENLLNYANAPIIVWDPHYRITRFNHAFEVLTGRREADVRGQSLELLFPPDLVASSMALIQKAQADERWETVEIAIQHCDGHRRTLLWNSATLVGADGATPVATIAQGQDITERTQMEQALHQRDALLQATAHASHILLAERDTDRAISAAIETIGRAANQDRVYIFENHVDTTTGTRLMSQRYEWTAHGVSAQINNPELQNLSYDELFPRWYEELGAQRLIEGRVCDFPASERLILEPQNIISLLVMPITIEGGFWGFIGFDNCHSAYAWSDGERSILTAAAAAIGTAIVQHRARRSLQHRALFGEIMIDIASRFVGAGNVDEAISQALAMVSEFVGADAGSVYLINNQNDALVTTHAWERAPAASAGPHAALAESVPWTLAELRRQRIVMLPSPEQTSAPARAELANLVAQGITTLLALPLSRHNTFTGMLAFVNPVRARAWDKSERSLLRVVATLFSNAIEKRDIDARLQQRTSELQERVHELNCLHMISTAMSNPGNTLAQMLARVIEILPKAWIREDAVALQVRVGENVYRTALYDEHQPGKLWNIRAFNTTAGALAAQFRDDSTEDSRFVKEILLEDIAERIGKTIEHVRALREMRKLSRAIEQAGESIYLTDCAGVIEYVNPAFEQMTGYTRLEAVGHTPRLLRSDLHEPAFYAHLRAVLQAGEIYRNVVINRRKDGTPYYQSMTIAPIKDDDGVIGHYVACAQDITELKRAEEQLAQARTQEVEIAAKIQQTLLIGYPPAPTAKLAIGAGTVPSQSVDGDFYDFYQQGTQALDIVIGDVMGKGIPAALLGAATKSLFPQVMQELRATHDRDRTPDARDIVNAVHREVTPELIALNSFITCCYLRFDLATDHLLMVDCGHTRSIHYHAARGQCEFLKGDNMPLGFNEREQYTQVILPYAEGDVLVLYSDGITDAQNSTGELFGEERLCAVVCAHATEEPAAVVRALSDAVVAFSGHATQRDDLTCIVTRVTATGEQLRHCEQLTIPSTYAALAGVRHAFERVLQDVPADALDETARPMLVLALQEALVNIIKHAYAERPDGHIEVTMKVYAEALFLELAHGGCSFDPKGITAPAFDGSRTNGFGMFIIGSCSDMISYHFGCEGNNLTVLRKSLAPCATPAPEAT